MIYVFEDDERDPISQLFRMAYVIVFHQKWKSNSYIR